MRYDVLATLVVVFALLAVFLVGVAIALPAVTDATTSETVTGDDVSVVYGIAEHGSGSTGATGVSASSRGRLVDVPSGR